MHACKNKHNKYTHIVLVRDLAVLKTNLSTISSGILDSSETTYKFKPSNYLQRIENKQLR